MLDILRGRISAYLMAQGIGVLSVSGGQGAWATPVRYRVEGLELDCLVPRWADVAYHLEQNPRVLLVILAPSPGAKEGQLRWLQYLGSARPVVSPDWRGLLPRGSPRQLAGDLYLIVRVVPERIDLVDESQGWGARETLEM